MEGSLFSPPAESPSVPFAARRCDEETFKRLCLASEFIDDCFEQSLDLQQISQQAFFSPYHFLRLFRQTYEELKQKGVEFMSPPQERPYGIEALLKDNSGNWCSMTQHQ